MRGNVRLSRYATGAASRLLALILVLISSCGRPQSGLRHVHIVVAGSPASLVYLPHLLAQQLGFYKQEGLDVLAETVPGGSKGMQALLGGSAEVIAGYYEHSIRVAAQGRAVRSFVTFTRYPGNVLLVSPRTKRRISRIQDLKGAAVGVPDPSSQAHLFVNYILVRNGLSPSDITTVSIGNQAGGVAAIEHGKIDVWSGFDPGITQVLKRHPDARILADARDETGVRETFGTDVYPGAVLYSTAVWLEHNPDAAKRLGRSLLRSLDWIHRHSPEQIMSQVPTSFRGEDQSVYLEALRRAMPMFSQDGRMIPEGAAAVANVLKLSLESVRAAKVDVSTTYTNEFVRGH